MTKKHIIMSTNNEEEVIIESENNNEQEVENNEPEEVVTESEAEKPERQRETPEERVARLRGQLKRAEKDAGIDTQEPAKKYNKKSDDLDYGEKAYLTSNGIKGAREFDFVKAELKASGENLDSLLENDYFQSKLEKFREINKTSDAIPKGGRSGSVPTDSVEYWMAKPIEEVPKDMRQKVVNAKLVKDKDKGVFYNS